MSDSNDRLERLKSRLIEAEVLAQCGLGFTNSQCLDYVKTLIKDFYRVTDSGEFETTDRTPLNPDLKPMPIEDLGGWLHEVHPYLFKQSATPGVSNAQTVAAPPNKSEMSLAEKCQFIRANGEQAFLDLPASPTAAKPLSEKRRSEMSPAERARLIRELGSAAYMDLPA